MKLPLPAAFFVAVSLLALRASAQEPRPVVRPPGSAQKSADTTEHGPALGDVLADYGRLVGKRVLPDITVNPAQPLALPDLDGVNPPGRAGLIERIIFLNGFTLFDADADTVVILGPGRNPRAFGVPLYTRPDEWPAGERVFSHLFRLEHRDAIEVAAILQQWVPGGNAVNFTADPKSSVVIATAPTSIMRLVLRVVAALDVASSPGR